MAKIRGKLTLRTYHEHHIAATCSTRGSGAFRARPTVGQIYISFSRGGHTYCLPWLYITQCGSAGIFAAIGWRLRWTRGSRGCRRRIWKGSHLRRTAASSGTTAARAPPQPTGPVPFRCFLVKPNEVGTGAEQCRSSLDSAGLCPRWSAPFGRGGHGMEIGARAISAKFPRRQPGAGGQKT